MRASYIGKNLIVLLALNSLLGCSKKTGEPDSRGGAAERKGAPGVELGQRNLVYVKKDSIEVRGKSLPFPVKLTALTEVLGKPSRRFVSANWTSTWDETGLLAFTKPNSDVVTELSLAFGKESYPFWPTATSEYGIQIASHVLTKTSGKKELMSAGFESDALVPNFWDCAVGETKVSVHLDIETQTKPVSIHINFGWIKG